MENLDQTYKRLLSENKKEEICKGCGEPISKCSCNTVEEAAETKKKPSWLISAEKRAEKKEGKVVKEGSSDVPFDMPYTTVKKTVTDKSGAKHGPMSRARDLARSALNKHLNATYNEYNPEKDKLKKQHFGMAEEVEKIEEIAKVRSWRYDKTNPSIHSRTDHADTPETRNQLAKDIKANRKHNAGKIGVSSGMVRSNAKGATDSQKTVKLGPDNVQLRTYRGIAKSKMHKEEVQIDEANHREFASQGKMHPDMAKHMDVGSHMDYYEPKTGDKVHGKVMHKSDTEVHMKQTHDSYDPKKVGTVHKFAVTSKLDEQIDEVLKPSMGAGAYIDDFLKSKNPKFAGKSADKRRQMALAAFYAAKKGVKEEVELDESEQKATPTVKTDKYSWGTMKTIHHGSSFSIPLHPEHHEHIAQMKDQQQHTIKTEDGKQYHVKREGDTVHFHGVNGGNKTSVPHKSLAEETQVDEAWVLRQKKKEKKHVKEENMISFKDFITEMEYDKNGRYVHKGKYGTSYDDPEGKEDSEKSTEKAEKRGRGRPAGAKSGARQIGGASKKGSGVEYTGYKLHLPNSNK